MKVLIIDDESKARDMLKFLLEIYIPEVKLVRMANGADQADHILRDYHPELVFLDIKMPGRDGFAWLKDLASRPFGVIFTTAHDQFAIRAIRFSAFDYLLKPIDAQSLQVAIDRFRNAVPTMVSAAFENLMYNTTQKGKAQFRLAVATKKDIHYLDPRDITRCIGEGNYTTIFLQTGTKIVSSRAIGHFEELLEPEGFVRCHKSHLVNLYFVDKLSGDGLIMKDGTLADVSRRRRKILKESLAKSSRAIP